MLVKYWMKTEVPWIDVDTSMQEAISVLKETRAALLPVMKKDRLVGVITDSDLKRASASDATALDMHELMYLISRIKANSVMSSPPVTVPPDYTLEETASRLSSHRISGAPVVDESGKVVGIISQQEIYEALSSLSGLAKRGIQLALLLEDRPGSIKEVTDVIRSHGARLVSILTSYDRVPEGYRRAYIRAYAVDRSTLAEMLEEVTQKARLLYMVDHKTDRREIREEPDFDMRKAAHDRTSSLVNGGKILLATDFSDNSIPARELALKYAKTLQADLHIVHVMDTTYDGYLVYGAYITEVSRMMDEMINASMEQTVKECKKVWERIESHVLSGRPEAEIVRFAAKENAHLIVMGTHGWTGVIHALVGSVAENVVRHARCPVLVVRPQTAER